jgi:hypothetical protein
MQRILEREDLSIGDRLHLYNQTLQRYRKRLEQYRQKPLGLVDIKQQPSPPPVVKEELVEKTPCLLLSHRKCNKAET